MPEYLAKYRTEAYMFDGGAWMPDPDAHSDEYRFKARSDKEALKKAKEHMKIFQKLYFGPKSTLEQLLKLGGEIKLK